MWPPSASAMNSSGLPYMLDMNMILLPSGDHAGALLVPRKCGQEISLLVIIEYMQICALQDRSRRRVAGKRDAAGVGRPSRRERDGMQRSELVLICAVVIHGPNLFVAAALADERNLRAGDSRQRRRKAGR